MDEKVIKKIDLGNGEYGVFAADQNTSGATLLSTDSEGLRDFFIDICYPVGSIYITTQSEFKVEYDENGKNPHDVPNWSPAGANWPGTWVKLDPNKFLLSADIKDAGTLGGSDKIDLSQLPEHVHNTPYYTNKPDEMINNLINTQSRGKLSVQADGHPVYYKFTSQNTTSAYSLNGIQMGGTLRNGHAQIELGRIGTSGGIYLEKDGNVVPAKLNQESYYPPYKKVTIWERIA